MENDVERNIDKVNLNEKIKRSENVNNGNIKNENIFTIGNRALPVLQTPSAREHGDNTSLYSESATRQGALRDRKRVVPLNQNPTLYLSPPRLGHSDENKPKKQGSGIKKNNSLVLNLVVPRAISNPSTPNRIERTFSFSNLYRLSDEFGGNGSSSDRLKLPTTNSVPNDPDYATAINEGYINQGYYASSEYSPSQATTSVPHTPKTLKPDNPTPPEVKKKIFSEILVNTLSIIYAMFIVTVGLGIYIADIVDGTYPIADAYSLILVSGSFLYILFLVIDIPRYTKRKQEYEKLLEQSIPENININETEDGQYQLDIVFPQITQFGLSIKHDYCFNLDRHSTNFYLKIGATAFCLGHLIHTGLIIGNQIQFLQKSKEYFNKCSSDIALVLNIFYGLYSFILLYFIFKYSNVIINKYRVFSRFGIMHCLSSSLCFWIWTIIREVLETIAQKSSYSSTIPSNDSDLIETPLDFMLSTNLNESFRKMPGDYFATRRFTVVCDEFELTNIITIYKDISPYLYPFSVEFSILVVGVFYLIWQNINVCDAEDEHQASTSACRNLPVNPDNAESNVTIHVDCQASSKGFFLGFLVILLTLISCILFFLSVFVNNGEEAETGLKVNNIIFLGILSVMFVACALGYWQITKLDINSSHHNYLDDILLYICIPAFILNGVFSVIPGIIYGNILEVFIDIVEICQVLLQTGFLLDGLRRSSNTKILRKMKPGRELVAFLLIANVALWIMQTFEVKSHGLEDSRYKYYGKELWTVLGHMCLPLMMFYRFHSSVCFCDIWKYAYEPSGH